MPLNLEIAQTLALGAFNPHIITPEWLIDNGVCEDDEVQVRFIPLSQGLAFSFKEVQWQIDFRLLMVESRKSDCGDLVAKVIGHLPHTPVRAIGNNFHYACSTEDWGAAPLPAGLDTLGSIEETRWAWVIRSEEVRMEVTLAKQDLGLAVLFNFHRETNPKDSDQAMRAARRFQEDRRASEKFLLDRFHQEVAIQ